MEAPLGWTGAMVISRGPWEHQRIPRGQPHDLESNPEAGLQRLRRTNM